MINQKIHINAAPYTIVNWGNIDNDHTFTISPGLDAVVYANEKIFPIVEAVGSATPWSPSNPDINFKSGQGHMFPLYNGKIKINTRHFIYQYKSGTTLKDVKSFDGDMSPLPIHTDDAIILQPCLHIKSTGTIDLGEDKISREINYYGALYEAPNDFPYFITKSFSR